MPVKTRAQHEWMLGKTSCLCIVFVASKVSPQCNAFQHADVFYLFCNVYKRIYLCSLISCRCLQFVE